MRQLATTGLKALRENTGVNMSVGEIRSLVAQLPVTSALEVCARR